MHVEAFASRSLSDQWGLWGEERGARAVMAVEFTKAETFLSQPARSGLRTGTPIRKKLHKQAAYALGKK